MLFEGEVDDWTRARTSPFSRNLVVMDEDLMGKLRNGQAATFIVFQTPEEGIGIPVSLNGFGKAFDGLP